MPEPTRDWLALKAVELAPDAIIVVDVQGIVRLRNAGAESMFGYRAEEALGQNLDLIIPDRLRKRLAELEAATRTQEGVPTA